MYCFTRSGSAKNPIQRRAVAPWRFSAGTYAGISRAEIPLRDLRQQIYTTCRARGHLLVTQLPRTKIPQRKWSSDPFPSLSPRKECEKEAKWAEFSDRGRSRKVQKLEAV
jgi:hypothetical protein